MPRSTVLLEELLTAMFATVLEETVSAAVAVDVTRIPYTVNGAEVAGTLMLFAVVALPIRLFDTVKAPTCAENCIPANVDPPAPLPPSVIDPTVLFMIAPPTV